MLIQIHNIQSNTQYSVQYTFQYTIFSPIHNTQSNTHSNTQYSVQYTIFSPIHNIQSNTQYSVQYTIFSPIHNNTQSNTHSNTHSNTQYSAQYTTRGLFSIKIYNIALLLCTSMKLVWISQHHICLHFSLFQINTQPVCFCDLKKRPVQLCWSEK